MFFRQSSPGRSVGGASHTRHLYGNKKERGGRVSLVASSVRHFYRAHHARVLQQPSTIRPLGQSSGPDNRVRKRANPPFSSNTRKQAGFFDFFPPRGFFLFFSLYHFSSSPNQNLSVPYYREPFEGQSALVRAAVVPLIKNFSSCR